MKFKLLFYLLTILSLQAYSQTKNNISIIYGTTSNDMDIHGAIGDFGYTGKGGMAYGLNYERTLEKSFSIITGLTFSDDKVQLNSILLQMKNIPVAQDEIKLITVPVLAKFTFLKYLFVDGGAIIDFQTNTPINSTTNKQSGIGFEIGAGLKYDFGHFGIFVNPYAQRHAAIDFAHFSGSAFNLMDAGFKFGLGYNFK